MHYDTLVIGAGMSGLAAGIRLAQFDRKVAILERHTLYGGLNSFYKLAGRRFDTGLHALTNFARRGESGKPLSKILRQLRLDYDALELGEQSGSEVAFLAGGATLRLHFSNDFELLRSEVARLFPSERDGFERLVRELPDYPSLASSDAASTSARARLAEFLREPLLCEMLLEPLFFYGGAREHDLDWRELGILFRSIFLEGFARPEGGIRALLDLLVGRFKEAGGELRLRTGVASILLRDGAAIGVRLDSGDEITCDQILSSAGWPETARMCGAPVERAAIGALSFLESISVLDRTPAELGQRETITFFNDSERFHYARPSGPIDARSGVICCPNNYASKTPLPEGLVRVTVLADPAHWSSLAEPEYQASKERASEEALASAARFVPDMRPHTVFKDVFTPRTIERFTGHINGAVYGSPTKHRDGASGFERLHLIGTDQGLVGIVGALLSGITMANRHALVAG